MAVILSRFVLGVSVRYSPIVLSAERSAAQCKYGLIGQSSQPPTQHRAENKLTKYGYFIPFVAVYPYEIERVCTCLFGRSEA
jgi:hypothetical protein